MISPVLPVKVSTELPPVVILVGDPLIVGDGVTLTVAVVTAFAEQLFASVTVKVYTGLLADKLLTVGLAALFEESVPGPVQA